MKILSREQILHADDLPQQIVDIPEWDGEVIVRALTGTERAQMVERFVAASKDNPDEPFNIHLAAATMCAEDGQPLFDCLADVHALAQRNGAALERVFKVARDLNGYNREAQKKSSGKTPK